MYTRTVSPGSHSSLLETTKKTIKQRNLAIFFEYPVDVEECSMGHYLCNYPRKLFEKSNLCLNQYTHTVCPLILPGAYYRNVCSEKESMAQTYRDS